MDAYVAEQRKKIDKYLWDEVNQVCPAPGAGRRLEDWGGLHEVLNRNDVPDEYKLMITRLYVHTLQADHGNEERDALQRQALESFAGAERFRFVALWAAVILIALVL